MKSLQIALLMMLLAFVVSTLLYPAVLRLAIRKNIVDNPNARKLQRAPVPVMGGTIVMIGMLIGCMIYMATSPDFHPSMLKILGLMLVMYVVGLWDDLKDISPELRFILEVGVVWSIYVLVYVNINNLHGLWGIGTLPKGISIPLSIVSGVGIINAINMIDGVDGYCSSFCIITCALFAILFYYTGDMNMFAMALIAIGALLPFFMHNVFGERSKMFMGDGGSMMLGTLLTIFVFKAVDGNSKCHVVDETGLSLVAFTLAIMAVPVFDTVRVMVVRMFRKVSPFKPDKTHLHHLFIDMNFSHLFTSLFIVCVNVLIVASVLIAWRLGASVDFQFYLVVTLAILFTTVFYYTFRHGQKHKHGFWYKLYYVLCFFGCFTNYNTTWGWQLIKRTVDNRFFGGWLKTGAQLKTRGADKELRIWNIKFNLFSLPEIVDRVGSWLDQGRRGIHLTGVSAETVTIAQKDELLRNAILDSDIVNVDSFLPAAILKLEGYDLKGRVPSPEVMEAFFHLANKKRQKVFFFGAKDSTLVKLRAVIEDEYPGIQIVGMRNGYYTDQEEADIARMISDLSPDYLFLGMPSPRKERFILKYKHSMNVGLFYGVGGAFDAKAGVLKRPPKFLQVMGLEGVLRILRNPRAYSYKFPLSLKIIRIALHED